VAQGEVQDRPGLRVPEALPDQAAVARVAAEGLEVRAEVAVLVEAEGRVGAVRAGPGEAGQVAAQCREVRAGAVVLVEAEGQVGAAAVRPL